MIITHPIRIVALLALLLSLACPGIARAQGIEVSATIDPPQIYAGTTAVLQITIAGADPATPPTPPGAPVVPGLTIEYSGTTSAPAPVVILNGRRQDTGPDKIILQYAVTPVAPGRYVIPEMPVRIGARTITTSQLVLRAIEPPVATDIAIVAEADNEMVFEGQPVTIVVTVYFFDVRTANFAASLPTGFELYPSVSPAEGNADNIVALEINGRPIRAAVGRGVREGKQWKTVSIAYTLIPTRTGTFEVPGITANLGIETGQRTRAMGLLSEPIIERRVARAEPITITVKPLPTDGRPADFTGLVGKFDIRTSATNTDVHVGEPIPFSMSITGPRPLERIAPPDLRTDPAFHTAFKVSPEGWAETTSPTGPARVREFSTTLRATSESVTEIPAISFSYFDPDRAEYRTASSKPIPLTIRETRQITAADAISSGNGAAGNSYALPRVERVTLDAGPTGPTFAAIPQRLTSQHLLLTEQLRSPIIAAAVALPPLTLSVTALLAMRRRSHDPALARSRRALRDAMARMGSSPTADRIADAVRTLLASRFALDAHTITAHDARRLISPTDPALADEAARALLAADAPRFSDGAAATSVAPIADPRALLTRLDKATAP